MFATIRRLLNRFLNKSRKINNEPLNRVSLIVIILIDIFILGNVFTGLDDISRWHLTPTEAYPCYTEWQSYREDNKQDKDYQLIRDSLNDGNRLAPSQKETYQRSTTDRLGTLSATCLQYAEYQDKINTPQNQLIINEINQKQSTISNLQQANSNIRSQYDSTLLEKIAGQSPDKSINQVAAEKAKQELDKNNVKISQTKEEITNLKQQLLQKPDSGSFIAFLKDGRQFKTVEEGYKQASFWYPSIQLALQSTFLVPLIVLGILVHQFALHRGYGLVALISWHLLVIFFIPLILKIFEFLQVGAIFQFFFDIISAIFGSLLFLVSYVYILLIPLIGFGIIKFFQKFILNPKLQAVNRIQKSRCVNCAKKIRHNDAYCPHCGYYQYVECHHCHELTYKHLPHCKHCGTVQDSVEL